MKNITNEEDKIEPGEAETPEVRASKKEAHRNIPRRLFEMKFQFTTTVQFQGLCHSWIF